MQGKKKNLVQYLCVKQVYFVFTGKREIGLSVDFSGFFSKLL
jgi:hypothetical protein